MAGGGSRSSSEVAHEFRFFSVFKDGTVEKFHTTHKIPPFTDAATGVQSKDVVISPEPAISARIFLPRIQDPAREKLPVLFYVHGGGFCFESAFSLNIHNYVSAIAAEAVAVVVSVEYRLAPEHPIPACYDDSWVALKWAAAHVSGNGPDAWLNHHADFSRLFIAGDSAGGNISHDLAVRVGSEGLPVGAAVKGMVMVHPYFGGTEDDAMWLYMCPENGGVEDRRLRPLPEDLRRVPAEKVLIFVAEKDHLRDVGKRYGEELKRSGWRGTVETVENEGEDHCFHINDLKLNHEKAIGLVHRFASFINQS